MKSGWVLALGLLPLAALVNCSSSGSSSATGHVWVATTGDQKLTVYAVNLTSGAASRAGSPVATGAQPSAMTMTPDRKLLFLTDTADDAVAIYTVNSDQTVKPACPSSSQSCSIATVPVGTNPIALAVDPSGKFLFVANEGTFADNTSGTISVFSISGTTLTSVSNGNPSCTPSGGPACAFPTEIPSDVSDSGPDGIIASPAGNFLYVSNQFTNTVERIVYDASTGVLTLPPTPYSAGTNPSGMAFSRCAGFTAATTACSAADGNNLFVANSGSNNVSVFTACIQVTAVCPAADGSLIQLSNSPVGAGISPTWLIVNPVANFVYVVDSKANEISQYQYNGSTGALTPLSNPVVSTASTPGPGGITTDGSIVLVPDTGGSTLSVYKADSVTSSTGAAPTGKLSVASSNSVPLSGQPSAVLVR